MKRFRCGFHTHRDAGFRQRSSVRITGILRSTIRMKQQFPSAGCRPSRAMRKAVSMSVSSWIAAIAHPITRRENRSSTTAR